MAGFPWPSTGSSQGLGRRSARRENRIFGTRGSERPKAECEGLLRSVEVAYLLLLSFGSSLQMGGTLQSPYTYSPLRSTSGFVEEHAMWSTIQLGTLILGKPIIVLLYLFITLRVQVPSNHILTQNLYYNYYCPKPKYQIIGYMDPLGK